MKVSNSFVLRAFCVGVLVTLAIQCSSAARDDQTLLETDRAAFGSSTTSIKSDGDLLAPNFSWTDPSGKTQTRSEVLEDLRQGRGLPNDSDGATARGQVPPKASVKARAYGQVGVIQEDRGALYILRVWIKLSADWHLLVYQAVRIGTPASSEADKGDCRNPCKAVPFQPQTEDERAVIHAYQSVEQAVAAHDSSAWGSHIADEFFAVTSNSDRPLSKAARMAGLDNQKVAGIAPFPLVSARMFSFGDAMVMTSVQQPLHGLPLHVTRIWFKRDGAWLEAYSYQTTIRKGDAAQ